MASMLILLDGFSRALVSFVFDSWCMYFLLGSNFAFLCVFGYFSLPIGIFIYLFCLMFFFDFDLTLIFLDD